MGGLRGGDGTLKSSAAKPPTLYLLPCLFPHLFSWSRLAPGPVGREGRVLGRALILLGPAELSRASPISPRWEDMVVPLPKGRLSTSYSVL